MKLLTPFFSMLFIALSSLTQNLPNQSKLELREIMKGEEFVGHLPGNVRWTIDSKKILFDWNRYSQPGNSTYAYDLATKKIDSVTMEFYMANGLATDTKNDQFALYTVEGNLFCYVFETREVKRVIKIKDHIRNVHYSPVTRLFYFQIATDLFSFDPTNNAIVQLAEFKSGTEKKEKTLNTLEKEELQHFQFLQEADKRKEWNESSNIFSKDEIPVIYHDKSSVSNIQVSGDGGFITFRVNDYPKIEDTHVEHHISSDGHTYTANARSKVSDKDPNHRLGIYDMTEDTVYYVDFSVLPDIRRKPAYLQEYGDTTTLYDQDRNIIMHKLIYSKDGKHNVFDIRSYDNKDRWIVSVDLKTGNIKVHDHQHDAAWIGGPGISGWNMVSGTLDWLDDNKTIYFQSEETGYSHLYYLNTENANRKQMTSGNWEVHEVYYAGKNHIDLLANKEHPGSYFVYQLRKNSYHPWISSASVREVVYSPDKKHIAYLASSVPSEPWDLFVQDNEAKSYRNRITSSKSEKFKSYDWYDPKVISFQDENNHPIYARLYEPAHPNGAAVIFVHGAGYLQNAHKYWSTYYREYMFHNLLRDNGITVIDIDYRASQGYGRDHRTAIYRHMGGADLQDQLLGRQYLIDSLGVDPERIGIYGGSYGGFITLMALLTEPGKFKCGAALRSVTDWFHYNHEYTSNILNYPGTDPDAYQKSSPIYYSDNLQDRLLMLHGMVDDNVQFQDVVRLSQKFIEAGKENWELAVFPVEAHGFKTASSWTDEYRRIYELFYEELILDK